MTKFKLLRIFVFAILCLNTYYVAAYQTQSIKRFVAPVVTPYQPHAYLGLGFIAPRNTQTTTSNIQLHFSQTLDYNASIHDNSGSIKDSAGYALVLGYRASQHWATEFGIYDNGQRQEETQAVLGIRSNEGTPVSNPRLVDTTIKQTGQTYDVDFSILRFIQLGHSSFSAFLRLGGGYHMYNVTGTSSTAIGTQKGSTGLVEAAKDKVESPGLLYGFGVQNDFNHALSARLDYMVFDESITSSGEKNSKFMLSALYNF